VALCGTWGWALVLAACNCAAQTPPLTEAERLIGAGHWKRARALVEAGARQHPGDALTAFLLSQIRNAFGDRESPLPLAERAVALDGAVAKYHRQVAEAVGVMAQHAGWLQQFVLARRFRHEIDTALAQDPRDLQALGDLMEFYLVAPGLVGGDKDKARAMAERIAAVDRVRGFSAQARLAEANGETGKVDLMLHKAVEAGPGSYRARVALAAWLLSRGNLEEARAQAAEAARTDGTRVDAYAVLAAVYANHNQTGELEAVLATAEQQVPDDLLPYYRSAEAFLASGHNLARAERYLRRYLSAEPEGNEPTLSEAHRKLGQVLERQGQTTEAAGGSGF
jgi:tetratricopeptide (TPR) repeat protein